MTLHGLIETYFPVRQVSDQAGREKNAGRDFHPSMLHWWWARRPLGAMRAALLGILVPRESFPDDRIDIDSYFEKVSSWVGNEIGMSEQALKEARRLVEDAWPDGPPKVIDSFLGGGSTLLEASRLGCDGAGIELNPVAFLVSTATVVWPQTYGSGLSEDTRKWGRWVRDRAYDEVKDLYIPVSVNGSAGTPTLDGGERAGVQPQAYLWTRTIPCPNPSPDLPRHRAPLIRSAFVARTRRNQIAVTVVPDIETGRFHYRLSPGAGNAPDEKRSKSSASTCRMASCGGALSADYLARHGSEIGHELVAVVVSAEGRRGKAYLSADDVPGAVPSDEILDVRLARLQADGLTPPADRIEPMGNAGLASGETYLYGIETYTDVFTKRQLVSLLTLCKYVRQARDAMVAEGMAEDRANVVAAYLGMAVNRVVDRSTSLCRWNLTRETAESPFIRDRLAMLWDFVEVNPFAGISGDMSAAVDAVSKGIRQCARTGRPADVRRGSATSLPFSDEAFDVAVVDPPYYDNFSYSNSSDFYYVWLKRSIGDLFPEHFAAPTAPKRQDIVAAAYRHNKDKDAANAEYESRMMESFKELHRVLKPDSPMIVVYAHQTTAGWSALIQSLRGAGFAVVEAWPVETERPQRRGGVDTASLASSIFLVARRRPTEQTGNWAVISEQLSELIPDRVQTLSELGISGDDLVIAVIGAGLRPFTEFSRVELDNGEEVSASTYLEEVQREVVETILAQVFSIPKSGVATIDPVSRFYVMGRFEFGNGWVDFDRVNTLARGIGAELRGSRGLLSGGHALLEKEKSNVRFLDYSSRGSRERLADVDPERGGRPALIDVLHRMLAVAETEPHKVRGVLRGAGVEPAQVRVLGQALVGETLERRGSGTTAREQTAIASLLASWKRLVEETGPEQLELS